MTAFSEADVRTRCASGALAPNLSFTKHSATGSYMRTGDIPRSGGRPVKSFCAQFLPEGTIGKYSSSLRKSRGPPFVGSILGASVTLVGGYHENRFAGFAQYTVADAAYQELIHCAASVGSDDNHINV